MIRVRRVRPDDLPVIAELMHNALEPYYGGDHRAHARRIVETAAKGKKDPKGHFSAAQLTYVAGEDGHVLGVINFVVKYQGTVKISPPIVHEAARGRGVSRALMRKLNEYAKKYRVRQVYCTVSARNYLALSFFVAQGYVRAGTAARHYRTDTDEIVLYKIVEHENLLPEEQTISIRPLIEEDEGQVRDLVLIRITSVSAGNGTVRGLYPQRHS